MEKIIVPIDTAKLVLERMNFDMKNPSVYITEDGELIPKSKNNTYDDNSDNRIDKYTVIVRKSKREGNISNKAKALKDCKGKTGCDFISCSKEVFGKLPKHLIKTEESCMLI